MQPGRTVPRWVHKTYLTFAVIGRFPAGPGRGSVRLRTELLVQEAWVVDVPVGVSVRAQGTGRAGGRGVAALRGDEQAAALVAGCQWVSCSTASRAQVAQMPTPGPQSWVFRLPQNEQLRARRSRRRRVLTRSPTH